MRWDYFRDKYTDIEECNDLEKIDQLLLYRTGILGASLEKVVRLVGEYFISISNYTFILESRIVRNHALSWDTIKQRLVDNDCWHGSASWTLEFWFIAVMLYCLFSGDGIQCWQHGGPRLHVWVLQQQLDCKGGDVSVPLHLLPGGGWGISGAVPGLLHAHSLGSSSYNLKIICSPMW